MKLYHAILRNSHSQYYKSSQPPRTVTPANTEALLIASQFQNEQKTAKNISTKLLQEKRKLYYISVMKISSLYT